MYQLMDAGLKLLWELKDLLFTDLDLDLGECWLTADS
jgi:hypothetical protein